MSCNDTMPKPELGIAACFGYRAVVATTPCPSQNTDTGRWLQHPTSLQRHHAQARTVVSATPDSAWNAVATTPCPSQNFRIQTFYRIPCQSCNDTMPKPEQLYLTRSSLPGIFGCNDTMPKPELLDFDAAGNEVVTVATTPCPSQNPPAPRAPITRRSPVATTPCPSQNLSEYGKLLNYKSLQRHHAQARTCSHAPLRSFHKCVATTPCPSQNIPWARVVGKGLAALQRHHAQART